MAATRRAVLLPDEGAEATRSSQVRGGKGANLAELAALGLPVPPFFTIPTTISRAYMEHGRLPKRFWWHLERGIAELEKATGRKFGCVDNPLLVSVRSGAPISMPGMMDTVLNVGMTSDCREALRALGGEEFVGDLYRRFREFYGIGDEPVYHKPSLPARRLPASIVSMLGQIALQGVNKTLSEEKLPKDKFYIEEILENKHEIILQKKENYQYLEEQFHNKGEALDFSDDFQGLQIGPMGTGKVNKGLLLGVVPGRKEEPGPWEQLESAIIAVLESWDSERARTYREANGIEHWIGTAVNVQAMVFGNLDDDSGTGVVFSTDPSTGKGGMFGEWLQRAQGEDIVSGTHTPLPISDLAERMPAVYDELEGYVQTAAEHVGGVAELEFTVESGKLFVLQDRKAKLSPRAAAHLAVHAQWEGLITKEQAVKSLRPSEITQLRCAAFSQEAVDAAKQEERLMVSGLPASPGAVVGYFAKNMEDVKFQLRNGHSPILLRKDTSPDDLPLMLACKAIVTAEGGATCHAAVVARGQGIPAVVGVGDIWELENYFGLVSVDASRGLVFSDKLPLEKGELTKEENIFLKWTAQIKPEPRLDLNLLNQQFNINRVVSDFYLAEAMAKACAGKSLEAEAAELWKQISESTATLVATYLAIAVGREFRHVQNYWHDAAGLVSVVPGKAGTLLRRLFQNRPNEATAMEWTATALPGMSLEEQVCFADAACMVFDLPGWAERPSYGGKKWAAIANALLGYLDGSLEPETFADHAFDLRHNGGVLFNKHPMVSAMTYEPAVSRQLDIKKNESDIGRLRERLMDVGKFYGLTNHNNEFGFSPEVTYLWGMGVRLGLW